MLGLAAQQPGAQRVERRDPHRPAVAIEQPLDPRAHLLGGLVGEGDGEDLVGTGVPLEHQPGDAMGDDPCLPGAGAGEDQQRAVDVHDRGPLFGVEGGEEIHWG